MDHSPSTKVATLITTLFLLSTLLVVPVSAIDTPTQETTIQCDNTTDKIDYSTVAILYNKNTEAIPNIIKPAVRSNTTELYIDGAEQKYHTINTNEAMEITSITLGQPETKDVIVETNKETACSLYTSTNPVKTFQTQYANNNIDIKPQGTIQSAAVFVIEKVNSFFN